jgi:hypothetical protein
MKAKQFRRFSRFLALSSCMLSAVPAYADSQIPNHSHSDFTLGPRGLNTVPNARMDAPGTIKAGISNSDPYLHGYIGFQIAKPLYIQLRQSAETSNIWDQADALYPGLDVKLRLLEETAWRPAIAIGMHSAIGERRMGGEYLALSKRYKNFDATAGIGWGRFGSAGHFSNPFSFLGGDYSRARDLSGTDTHEPSDWFSGNEIGIFGGLEYFTPWEGLSLKLDWGADRYSAERAAINFEAPAPWSAGISYSPKPWANIGVGMQGTDKVMARMTLLSNLQYWPGNRDVKTTGATLQTARADNPNTAQIEEQDGSRLTLLTPEPTPENHHETAAALWLNADENTPAQLGRAAIHMANHSAADVEVLHIKPRMMGLSGPNISLMRRDLERLHLERQGSAAEVWRSARIQQGNQWRWPGQDNGGKFISGGFDYGLTIENLTSLSEEDTGILGRSALLADLRTPQFFGLLHIDGGVRYNYASNLGNLTYYRPRSADPVRSDIDLFAARGLALEKLSASLTHSPRSDLHMAISGGYLEEMYAGFGGEILYRPYNKRYAFGVEGWQAYKRDPYSTLNLDRTGQSVFSGHVNAWYDLPVWDLTLKGQFGRYLAQDVGGSLSLHKYFNNGVKLESFVTLTDQSDYDVYGGRSHAFHGVRLSLPLGAIPFIPGNTKMITRVESVGRDAGQNINKPIDLYDATNRFSYKHIGDTWTEISSQHKDDERGQKK